jgi:hypothetical protein
MNSKILLLMTMVPVFANGAQRDNHDGNRRGQASRMVKLAALAVVSVGGIVAVNSLDATTLPQFSSGSVGWVVLGTGVAGAIGATVLTAGVGPAVFGVVAGTYLGVRAAEYDYTANKNTSKET